MIPFRLLRFHLQSQEGSSGASAELTGLQDLSSATCSANTISVVPGGSVSPAWEVTEPASESVSV